jgi:transcriptional regulator with XRE-family HTH domain
MSNLEQQEASALAGRIRFAFGDMNLREIARALDLSYSGLNHVLHGRRRITADLLEQVFRLTGYSIHWLVTGEGSDKAEPAYGVADLDQAVKEFVSQVLDAYTVKRRQIVEGKQPRNPSKAGGRQGT